CARLCDEPGIRRGQGAEGRRRKHRHHGGRRGLIRPESPSIVLSPAVGQPELRFTVCLFWRPYSGDVRCVMSNLLFMLEGHFDALADEWQGYFMGWLSRGLRGFFALIGDVMQPRSIVQRF